ncbi:MAG: hypothetical protein K0R73_847 [Candidatus Midichloriaceae bacterium]|jgi:hypothetical protein|nr:hypothetical protein [Candidatus Midichloriaceae bacterium]
MKTQRPEVNKTKESTPEIQLERAGHNKVHKLPIYFLISLNIIILCLAGVAAQQILFVPQNPPQLAVDLGRVMHELNDIKRISTESKDVEKQSHEFYQKEEQWKKMSERYHLMLLANVIKKKIILGEGYAQELEEMKKFSLAHDDANYQILLEYMSARLNVKTLIAGLYDVKNTGNNKQQIASQGFIESIKHFFNGLFVVQKLEGEKIRATSNEIISLMVELLLDEEIEAAYIVANKFRQVNEDIANLAENLKPARDALIAVDKLSSIYG